MKHSYLGGCRRRPGLPLIPGLDHAAGEIACGAWHRGRHCGLRPDQGSARPGARYSAGVQSRAIVDAAADAPPTLDWWRGFRSRRTDRPDGRSPDRQSRHRRRPPRGSVRRMRRPASPAQRCCRASTPTVRRAIPRTSGSSASGLTHRRTRGGQLLVVARAPSYELDFWGKNRDAAQSAEETAVANRFDRDVVALTTLTSVANAYFQVLSAQDRLRTAQRTSPAPSAFSTPSQNVSRPAPAPTSTSRSRKAWSPTSGRWCHRCGKRSTRTSTHWPRLVSRPPESRAGHRRIAQPDRPSPRVTPGLPSELLTQRPDIRRQEAQLASGHRQCRQRPRAVLSEHPADRAGRLPEPGADRRCFSHTPRSSAWSAA